MSKWDELRIWLQKEYEDDIAVGLPHQFLSASTIFAVQQQIRKLDDKEFCESLTAAGY